MADKKETQIIGDLITATLPPEQRAVAHRIIARFGDFFRTRDFEFGPGDTRRIEARIDPVSRLWVIEEFRTIPALYADVDGNIPPAGKQAQQILPVLSGACLVDALHFCARYEIAARDAHGAEASGENVKKLGRSYYRAFGEHEGIAFDRKTNFPVLAADGKRLMPGGVLDENDLEIIRKSEGNLAPEKGPESAVVSELSARTLAAGPRDLDATIRDIKSLAATQANQQKAIQKNREKVQDLNKKLRTITNDFKDAVTTGFRKNPVKGIGGMVLWGGLGYLSGWWIICGAFIGFHALRTAKSWYYSDPAANFAREMAHLESGIQKLPEGPLKAHAKSLAADAEIAFFSLYFRGALRETSIYSSGTEKTNKALDLLLTACKKHMAGMSPEGRDKEIAGVLEGLRENIMDIDFDEKMATLLYHRMIKLVSHLEDYKNQPVMSIAQIPAPETPRQTGKPRRGMPKIKFLPD